jgi:hypothetical protein
VRLDTERVVRRASYTYGGRAVGGNQPRAGFELREHRPGAGRGVRPSRNEAIRETTNWASGGHAVSGSRTVCPGSGQSVGHASRMSAIDASRKSPVAAACGIRGQSTPCGIRPRGQSTRAGFSCRRGVRDSPGANNPVRDSTRPASSTTISEVYASYYIDDALQCGGDGVNGCTAADFIRPGSKPFGNARWGHADMAGNTVEWTLDNSTGGAVFPMPCVNCANVMWNGNRRTRGGG